MASLKPENILLCPSTTTSSSSGSERRAEEAPQVVSSDSLEAAAAPSSEANSKGGGRRLGVSSDVKLIDFGSACFEGRTMYSYIQSRFYRSPEVLVGLPYGAPIDLWSLGCVCAEMFLGYTSECWYFTNSSYLFFLCRLPLFPGVSQHNQLSRIIEMLGPPPDDMIERGKNGLKYFCRNTIMKRNTSMSFASLPLEPSTSREEEVASLGSQTVPQPRYRLKTAEEYAAETNSEVPVLRKYLRYSRLEDVVIKCPLANKSKLSSAQKAEEIRNRRCFLDFLLMLLKVDPSERWTARQANNHPFITNAPFPPEAVSANASAEGLQVNIDVANPSNTIKADITTAPSENTSSFAKSDVAMEQPPALPHPTLTTSQLGAQAHQNIPSKATPHKTPQQPQQQQQQPYRHQQPPQQISGSYQSYSNSAHAFASVGGNNQSYTLHSTRKTPPRRQSVPYGNYNYGSYPNNVSSIPPEYPLSHNAGAYHSAQLAPRLPSQSYGQQQFLQQQQQQSFDPRLLGNPYLAMQPPHHPRDNMMYQQQPQSYYATGSYGTAVGSAGSSSYMSGSMQYQQPPYYFTDFGHALMRPDMNEHRHMMSQQEENLYWSNSGNTGYTPSSSWQQHHQQQPLQGMSGSAGGSYLSPRHSSQQQQQSMMGGGSYTTNYYPSSLTRDGQKPYLPLSRQGSFNSGSGAKAHQGNAPRFRSSHSSSTQENVAELASRLDGAFEGVKGYSKVTFADQNMKRRSHSMKRSISKEKVKEGDGDADWDPFFAADDLDGSLNGSIVGSEGKEHDAEAEEEEINDGDQGSRIGDDEEEDKLATEKSAAKNYLLMQHEKFLKQQLEYRDDFDSDR